MSYCSPPLHRTPHVLCFSIIAAAILALVGCSDRNPVAVYRGGIITRAELRERMRGYDTARQTDIVENMERQKNEIYAIIDERLLTAEARRRGIDKQKRYLDRLQQKTAELKQNVYVQNIFPARVHLTGHDIDLLSYRYTIGFIFAPMPAYLPPALRDPILADVTKMCAKALSAGASNISDLTNLCRPDWRVVESMPSFDYYAIDADIAKTAMSMKPGEFKSVDLPFGTALIQLIKREKKSKEEIAALKHNADIRARHTGLKINSMQQQYADRILKKASVTRYYDRLKEMPQSNDIIVSGAVTVTGSDFYELMTRLKPDPSAPLFAMDEYRKLFEQWGLRCNAVEMYAVRQRLLAKHFNDMAIDNHPLVKRTLASARNTTLIQTLLQDIRSTAATNTGDTAIANTAIASTAAADAAERQFRDTIRVEANIHFYIENFLTAIPFPPKKTAPAPAVQPKQKRADSRNPFLSFYEDVILGGQKGMTERALKNLAHTYGKLSGKTGDDLKRTIAANEPGIRRANAMLIRAFKLKPGTAFCLRVFTFYHEQGDTKRATEWLVRLGEIPGFDMRVLEAMLKESDEKRYAVLEAIGYIPDARIFPLLFSMLTATTNDHDRMMVIDAIGKTRDMRAVPALERFLKNNNELWGVRVMALEALRTITGNEYTNVHITPR
ncbi:MAG: HEAT repeat domain-containing protein [Spirochaetes bacterium]|nr:HEAT repeat domain-containing protein [Spirochaetota bacterium]